jgi:hypothetical protein
VTFTTCTLIASFLLFQGFNTADPVNTISLLCGFLIIFSGVYLLNLSREDPDGRNALGNTFSDAPPTDGISGFPTRRSMQARRSTDSGFRSPFLHGNGSARNSTSDRRALMQDYDVENQFELGDLADDSDEGDASGKRTSFDEDHPRQNGGLAGSGSVRVKKETVRTNTKGSER